MEADRHIYSPVRFLLRRLSSAAAPTITTLSIATGGVGASVTVAGANFGPTPGTSTVKFNAATATVMATKLDDNNDQDHGSDRCDNRKSTKRHGRMAFSSLMERGKSHERYVFHDANPTEAEATAAGENSRALLRNLSMNQDFRQYLGVQCQ
jgi:hypothetical protein